MNPYRIAPPPQWWPPKLKPRMVRLLRLLRQRLRVREQRLIEIEVHGLEPVREALAAGHGMLITPNHPTHADAHSMYAMSDRVGRPFYFMATWHVFTTRTRLGRRALQWHGVFSVDREGTDLRAFKQAVDIVQRQPFPLVIFPEGEVYHCNDRVTPFREGAAMVALSAAKRAKRHIQCVPCALKYEYLEDPTPTLLTTMAELERHIHWRPQPDRSLVERIYRFAEAAMSIKEIEFHERAMPGTLPERTKALANYLLDRLETRHGIDPDGRTIPERTKQLRRLALEKLETMARDDPGRKQVNDELDDLFLVVQAFSYPGNYVAEQPSIERLAETIDKFEEDVLGKYSPTIRAARKVTIRLGEPIAVESTRGSRASAVELTDRLERQVQAMLDLHRRVE
ncbi:MAG TPA: glycerol acyltransferase [Planctomycetaceae bacterium]|nr:glycerol acyltransferase [Planctomycetaceae bacterium]